MSIPIRLALAVVAAVASVAGGPAPAAVPGATDVQGSTAALQHADVEELGVDLVDVDGQAVARTTQLSSQAAQIAQAVADIRAAQQKQSKPTPVAKPATAPAPVPAGSPTDARAIARQLMLSLYGWDDTQFQCFDKIITQESNWNVYATNASSGAYGIPQALPGSKMATAGADWQTNPATQITWALGYVNGRYSTPCAAWSFKSAHGWY